MTARCEMAEYVKRRQKPVKEDARVTKTKERLRESLLDLMEDKPLADISITALCASAHMNRNTFYAHYGSPADVLDELMADLGSAVAHSLAVTRRHGSVAWLTELCENVQENQHAYEMLFATSDGRTYIEREILSAYKLVMDSTAERIRRNPRHADAFAFAAGGSMALLERWVSEGAQGSPEDMACLINRLCKTGMSGIFDED